jgi:hypothetical protein
MRERNERILDPSEYFSYVVVKDHLAIIKKVERSHIELAMLWSMQTSQKSKTWK